MKDYTPIIPKEKLVHGAYYIGRCRNASVARWNGDTQNFVHWRRKFNNTFLEEIKAPEDEAHFDVFVAEEFIEDISKIRIIPLTGEK